jgi:hypothetical protein
MWAWKGALLRAARPISASRYTYGLLASDGHTRAFEGTLADIEAWLMTGGHPPLFQSIDDIAPESWRLAVNVFDALLQMHVGGDPDDHGARLAAAARRILHEGRTHP